MTLESEFLGLWPLKAQLRICEHLGSFGRFIFIFVEI